jgi:hypothetical protein
MRWIHSKAAQKVEEIIDRREEKTDFESMEFGDDRHPSV